MYVYIRSEPNLYTVGHYKPDGKWVSESDHDTKEEAAARVHWLNGGQDGENETLKAINRAWDQTIDI